MEVFDQLAQFVCNRYPLNSKARKLGPSRPVKINIDTISGNRAILSPYPFNVDPLIVAFPARLVPHRAYKDPEDFLNEFYQAERITVTHTLAST